VVVESQCCGPQYPGHTPLVRHSRDRPQNLPLPPTQASQSERTVPVASPRSAASHMAAAPRGGP